MELRLVLEPADGEPRDVIVEVDGDAPVDALVAALRRHVGVGPEIATAAVCERTARVIAGALPVRSLDLRDGALKPRHGS